MRALIVTDGESAALLAAALRRADYATAITHVEGRDALLHELTTSEGWDVALCSAVLAAEETAEVLALLRRHAPGIPVIAIAPPQAEARAAAMMIAEAAVDYLLTDRLARLPLVLTRNVGRRGQPWAASPAAGPRALYEAMTSAVVVQALTGEIVYANPAAAALCGMPLAAIKGRRPWDTIQFSDGQGQRLTLHDLPATLHIDPGERSRGVILRLERSDGERRWVQAEIAPVPGPDGTPVRFITCLLDVTVRIDTEEALGAQARRQAALVKVGRAAMWNREPEALLQIAAAAVAAALVADLTAVLEEQPERQALLLRAGIGWEPGVVGTAFPIPTEDQRAGGALGGSGERLPDAWVRATPWMRAAGVVSGVSVEIPLHVRTFGILGAYTRSERSFTEDDVRFLQTVAAILASAIEQRQASAARHESEARLQRIVGASPDLISIVDRDGRFRFANAAYLRLLGYPPGSLVGQDALALLHPEDAGRLAALLGGAPVVDREALPLEFICRTRHAAGHYVSVELKWERFEEDEDAFAGVLLIARDISERLRAETALRERERRFRAMIEHNADAISLVARDGTVLYASPSSQHMLGYAPTAFMGSQPASLVHPDDRAIAEQALSSVLREQRATASAEIRIRHQDGSWRWIEGTSTNLLGVRGLDAIVVNYRDVTTRRRSDDARQFLLQAGEVLSRSLDYATTLASVARLAVPLLADWCAVYTAEEDGSIRRVGVAADTPAVEELLREIQGRFPLDPNGPHPVAVALRTGAGELTPELPEQRIEDYFDAEHLHLSRRLGGHSRMTVVLEAHGRRLGVLLFDFTRPGRRHTPADFALAQDLARRAAVAVDNARAHAELEARRGQLQALVGRLLLAQEEERRRVAHDVHDGLAQIAAATHQHLQAFVGRYHPRRPETRAALSEIVALAQRTVQEARRVVAGLRPIVLDDFGLSTALRQEVDALRAEGWQITIEDTAGDRRLPAAVETVLFRVAQEAITNARKHAGETRLHLALLRLAGSVRLEVKDWGRGFDPSAPAHPAGPGERIGLQGMRERVTLLGGALEIQSRPGEGTRIVAVVPVPETSEGGNAG